VSRPRVAVLCGVLGAGLVGAGLVGVLRAVRGDATFAGAALLVGAGVVAGAVGVARLPAPRGVGPRLVDLAAPGAGAPRWALVARHDAWRSSAAGLGALGVVLWAAGTTLDGIRSGSAATIAEGAGGVVVVGAVAGVLLARSLAHRSVALTADAVVVRAGRVRLEIPWGTVRAVRSHGAEDPAGRPRRIALDVAGLRPPSPASRLHDRLAGGTAARPGAPRVLVLPTAGLDTDPALLLAALDHYLELPAERAAIADHDWSDAS
jgi:hypothetical protein